MYKKSIRGWLENLDFVFWDEVCLVVSLTLAMLFSRLFGHPVQMESIGEFFLDTILINFFLLATVDSLQGVMHRSYLQELKNSAKHAVFVMGLLMALFYLRKDRSDFPRTFTILSILLYVALNCSVRILWKYYLKKRSRKETAKQSLLIVTHEADAPEILSHMAMYDFEKYYVSGLVLVDRDAKWDTVQGVPVVANLSECADYLKSAWTDEVLFFRVSPDEECRDLLRRCHEMAVTIHLYVALPGLGKHRRMVERLGGYDVLTTNINFMKPEDAIVKRTFDILAGLVGSFFALLLMAALGPFIYLASPGPILYKQRRVGENGRTFTMYKLRSMYLDADERKAALARMNDHADGMMFKMKFDPRVIGNQIMPDGTRKRGIGDFIRRTSLDEFPQFFNVLKGDMSIVGTRPPTLDEWNKYEYRHRARMSMRPGLTGLWQIRPDKDSMDFDQVVRLDTEYIFNWSLMTDMKIILQTVATMLRHFLFGHGTAAPGIARRVKIYPKEKKLKIAMIGHKWIPSLDGGVEKTVAEQSVRLAALGHKVVVYNQRKREHPDRPKEYRGVRMIHVPAPGEKWGMPIYAFLATVHAIFARYDVVSYHTSGACAMIPLARFFGLRCFASLHGLDSNRAETGTGTYRLRMTGERYAARRAQTCMVLSESMRTYIREKYGTEAVCFANGVALPEKEKADEITSRWGLEKDGYILFLGQIVPEKGLHYLISAFRSCTTKKKLVITGAENNNRDYFEELQRIAAGDRRIIFTGLVSGKNWRELYSNAYLFVLPSNVEGMSNTLLEAMSFGNCCLISDIPENTELAGERAVVFRKGNIGDLQAHLQELIDKPELVEEKRRGAAAYITENYSWDWVIEEILQVFRGHPVDYLTIRETHQGNAPAG